MTRLMMMLGAAAALGNEGPDFGTGAVPDKAKRGAKAAKKKARKTPRDKPRKRRRR